MKSNTEHPVGKESQASTIASPKAKPKKEQRKGRETPMPLLSPTAPIALTAESKSRVAPEARSELHIALVGPSILVRGLHDILCRDTAPETNYQLRDYVIPAPRTGREALPTALCADILLLCQCSLGEWFRTIATGVCPTKAKARPRYILLVTEMSLSDGDQWIAEQNAIQVFLSLRDKADILQQGIEAAAARRPYITPALRPTPSSEKQEGLVMPPFCFSIGSADETTAPLSSQQQKVFTLTVQGLTKPQIAATLHISVNTVKTHLNAVYKKKGIHQRGQLK
jgi:DNA-binding CsgD family transcriptional regulator